MTRKQAVLLILAGSAECAAQSGHSTKPEEFPLAIEKRNIGVIFTLTDEKAENEVAIAVRYRGKEKRLTAKQIWEALQ